jgi:hypothetical protein
MTDNVIEAAQRFRNQTESRASRDPQANAERHRNIERMKLSQITTRIQSGGNPLLRFDKDDCLRAAIALGELRSKLERGQMVLAKAKFEKINRFMITPDFDLSDRTASKKKADDLSGKVSEYLKAARVFAEIGNSDLDDAQIHVLRTTKLWQQYGRPTARRGTVEIDEAANAVAMLLQRLGARVIRDADLQQLFARMRRVPGVWDISRAKFRESAMACLFQGAYQEWNEEWDEVPPLPSVPLVRLRHAGWELPVRVAHDGHAEPYDRYSPRPLAENESDEFAAEVTLYREIRLALGPTVNANTLGPLFESRPHAELRLLGKDGGESRSGPLDPGHLHAFSANVSAVLLDGLWYHTIPLADIEPEYPSDDYFQTIAKSLTGTHVENAFLWDWTPLGKDKQCFDNNYLSWTPVDAAHVAHWLDRIERDAPSHPVEFLFFSETPPAKPVKGTWFPRPILGHLVETAIADGRLERALHSEIERIRSAFEKQEDQWRSHMQEQTAEQIAAFNSDLSAHAPTPSEPKEIRDDQ